MKPTTTIAVRPACSIDKAADDLLAEMNDTYTAMRKARASLLGVTLEELTRRDNRAYLITSVAKEHELSIEDATNYVNDMEKMAREEALRETHAPEITRERAEAHASQLSDEREAVRHDL